jgi:oligo-1,6-glucosidase
MHEHVFAGRSGEYLTVGEMPGVTVADAQLFTDPARAEVDMVFQFEHVGLDHGPGGKWDPREASVLELKQSFARWQAGLAESGWNSLYWNNHDQPRVVSRFGDDGPLRRASATALGTVLHLQRGTPYIYQGEELGMTNVPFEGIHDFRDIESLNHYSEAVGALGARADDVLAALRTTSRDNARTPVQWSDDPHGGFTTGSPWIAVNPNYTEINAAVQREDASSVFAYYRELIALRHRDRVVSHGALEMVLFEHPTVFAYTRTLDDRQLLVLANLSSESAEYDLAELPGWEGAEQVLANIPDAVPAADGRLAPWQAQVFARTR